MRQTSCLVTASDRYYALQYKIMPSCLLLAGAANAQLRHGRDEGDVLPGRHRHYRSYGAGAKCACWLQGCLCLYQPWCHALDVLVYAYYDLF